MKQLQVEAFDFFEKLLDKSLIPTWRKIVAQECESDDYIDLKGQKNTSGSKRGLTHSLLLQSNALGVHTGCRREDQAVHDHHGPSR